MEYKPQREVFSCPILAPHSLYRVQVAAAAGFPPLDPGPLRAHQELGGCGLTSAATEITVRDAATPPAPQAFHFCPEIQRIVVGNLRPGGVLHVSAIEFNGTTEIGIGARGIGATVEQVDLPEVVGGEGPILNIVVRQTVCGLTSPPGFAGEFARPGSGALPPPQPHITEPLFACMRAVPATGLLNGTLVAAFSQHTGQQLSDQIIVTNPTSRVQTWFPLRADDVVELRQVGCGAPSPSSAASVNRLPEPLPTPAIAGPVRPGTRAIFVKGCLPGARVHLLVNFQERAASDQTWTGETTFELEKGLDERAPLWAVQTMCTASSPREGRPTIVTRGRLRVEAIPHAVEGGRPASITVTAHDFDTGDALPGLRVSIAGQVVGVTGTAFGWTGPTAGTAVSGALRAVWVTSTRASRSHCSRLCQ